MSDEDSSEQTEDATSGKGHTCKICNKTFTESRQLGGHFSRAHPGESEQYNKRKNARVRNFRNRLVLKEAQRRYRLKYGFDVRGPDMNRSELRRMKVAVSAEIDEAGHLPYVLSAEYHTAHKVRPGRKSSA